MSKNAEGWVRHRGGKCPVEAGVEVSTRHRDGKIVEVHHMTAYADASAASLKCVWSHKNDDDDIMAYRLHKPAEQVEACSKPDPRDSAKRDSDYVCWMRDRITEIDATTQALTTERAELVQKLASEGFALIGRINDLLTEAAQKHEDMSDWRNWKVGDVVRYEGLPDFHSRYFTIGNLYEIKVVEAGDDCKNIYNPVIFKADDSGEENGWRPELFKFHSRPSA